VQPSIVHVTLDPQGKVEESEVLETSATSAQALALIAQSTLAAFALPQADGTPPRQREAYVQVEFVPVRTP
jgi:hypothetical protein